MEKSVDTFTWTSQLKCPPTICNDAVMKVLCSGFVGLMWDDIADIIFSAEEAKTIRKNILLHHLKQGSSNKAIQCTKNISQLKLEQNDLKTQISKLEKEYEQQDFVVRQKAQKLREISSKRSEIRVRRDLLKMKYDQTSTQLNDCIQMKLICQHLMPATCRDLDDKVLKEITDVVTSLWTGADKRQVCNIVLNNLSHIEVPTLRRHLYKNLTEDVDTLIKLEYRKSIDAHEKGINIGIAKIYGQHISMVSKQLSYNARANNHQQNVLEFIEKIEKASNNCTNTSEWLALALEVHKLETEKTSLQEEIERCRDNLHENSTFEFDLTELALEIQNIDTEIAKYVQLVQQSLHLLKSASTNLKQEKEKINLELEEIITIRADGWDSTLLNKDLTIELDIFQDILDLNALRRIMLKGNIGIYKYTKSCFSETFVPVTNLKISNITSHFPLIQTPIYSLIDCYKNLISTSTYKKLESLETEENSNLLQLPTLTYEENNYNTLELLNLSKNVNARTKTEIDEFNTIRDAWVKQSVQKVMEIIDKTVDEATFSEWIERYNLLLYMLKKST
ncbi:uncharacterized protein LOC143425391 [Xylocopa sonorina]|uniref:uncharacterized protein LOC143425391 n=1 Tax=Xylocopa sonorina TaxID=1818115 RepID=UPI00403B3264